MDTFPQREYTLRADYNISPFLAITVKGVIGLAIDLFKLSGKLAIDGIDKAKKDLDSTSSAAKDTAENAEKLNDSFEKLTHKITSQQNKVDLLKQKYADLCLTHGKSSKEAKECAEEIENLSTELQQNKAKLEEATHAADSLDKSLEETGKSGKGFGEKLKGLGKAATAVVGTFVAVGTAIVALESETREYRTAMGKLDAAFTTAGHSSEAATKTYKTLQSVLGETDRSVEAANHLAKLTDNEKDLEKWTNICTGVFATFGDSLPIEGLTEAANETAKVGQVTGPLADALNWAGVSEDEFNKALAACNDESERAALITETLNDLYDKAAEAYRHENKAILEANAAQEKWNEAVARIGEIIAPAANAIKSKLADALNKAVDAYEKFRNKVKNADSELWEHTQTSEEAAAVVESLKSQIEALSATDPGYWNEMHQAEYDRLRNALKGAEDNYYALVEAEAAAGNQSAETASQASTATDDFSNSIQTVLEEYKATYEAIFAEVGAWFGPFEKAKTKAVGSVRDWTNALKSQEQFYTSYNNNLQTLVDNGLGDLASYFQSMGEDGASYVERFLLEIERAGGFSTTKGQELVNGLTGAISNAEESAAGLTGTMTEIEGDFTGKVDNMVKSVTEGVGSLELGEEAYTAAQTTFSQYLAGMESQTPGIQTAMATLGQLITSTVQANISPVTVPVVTASVNGGDVTVDPNIDGSHASGLDYVPFDGYIAQLHKREAVLTAEEATAWRNAKANGGNVPAQSAPQEIVTNVTLELDGAVLARQLFRHNQVVTNDRGKAFVRG